MDLGFVETDFSILEKRTHRSRRSSIGRKSKLGRIHYDYGDNSGKNDSYQNKKMPSMYLGVDGDDSLFNNSSHYHNRGSDNYTEKPAPRHKISSFNLNIPLGSGNAIVPGKKQGIFLKK